MVDPNPPPIRGQSSAPAGIPPPHPSAFQLSENLNETLVMFYVCKQQANKYRYLANYLSSFKGDSAPQPYRGVVSANWLPGNQTYTPVGKVLNILSWIFLLLPAIQALPLPSLISRATRKEVTVTRNRVCLSPAPWTQILSFFLTNYIARIATFKKTSGYKGSRDHVRTAISLFVPFYGISQAAETVARGARFLGRDQLGGALHAGALCVVQRLESWRPTDGGIVSGCIIKPPPSRKGRRRRGRRKRVSIDTDEAIVKIQLPTMKQIDDPTKWSIQGQYNLPQGYCFSFLPAGTSIGPINPNTHREDIVIASSYGTAKSFTGVLQIIISIFSLYSSSSDQVNLYGYAAFGFSVIPYTIMSFLNAIANSIEADYDSLCMVESEVMVEAYQRTGEEFIGAVAALKSSYDKEGVDLKFRRSRERGWRAYEVDEAGEEVGRRWRVTFEEEEINSENFSTPARINENAAIMMVPAEGQYRLKKKVVELSQKFYNFSVFIIVVISLVIPYIVLGSLSHFKPADSTARQRTFMMGWLVVGQVIGVVDLIESTGGGKKRWWDLLEDSIKIVIVIAGFAFAVGGFVEAGRMMRDFGFCFRT
ncbi:hypothetical protein C7212DRAFT_361155 [Tuber magnatum]|uniref:Uncharacterized protein n=1 Tax=Tuber magnatum TaxID=42249 RepID=A0A317T0E3_9PEZI|nr:hypothetical protein C7212DRAFT_361155 [Tuber magnatum]